MRIKYLGPSPAINVGVDGKVLVHVKGKTRDYPDEVGDKLLQDKKNDFEAAGGDPPEKEPEVRSQKSEAKNPKNPKPLAKKQGL